MNKTLLEPIIVLAIFAGLVWLFRKVTVTTLFLFIARMAVLGFAIVSFVRMINVADRAPEPDIAIAKVVGFWIMCAVIILTVQATLTAIFRFKSNGATLVTNFIGAALCWLVYGLMF